MAFGSGHGLMTKFGTGIRSATLEAATIEASA
jgi:hypothetical protein